MMEQKLLIKPDLLNIMEIMENQWWFYNRDEPENPAYSDFYIENDKTYYSTIYNNAEKIVIDGSKDSPLHNRSYTFTLKSNQICPKKLYNGDGVSNIYLQDSTNSLYKQDVNKYAEFDIKEISEKDGVKTYEITRMDPSPHPNQEASDIEPPRNLDFKLVFFCNYNTSDNNKFEKIKSRTLKCPPGQKLQLPTSKVISNKYSKENSYQNSFSDAIGTDYNQKGLYFNIENNNNLYFSNNSNYIVKDVSFNNVNSNNIEFINHAFQNGWLPNVNNQTPSIYENIKGLDNIVSSNSLMTNDAQFLENITDVINTKILKIMSI